MTSHGLARANIAVGRVRRSRDRWVVDATAIGLVLLGFVAMRIGFGPFQWHLGLLTLLTGWIVGALGLATWQRVPSSRTGPILCVVAALWFVPGLAFVAWPPLALAAGRLGLAWVPALAVAIVGYPSGRLQERWAWLAISVTTAAALIPSARQELILGMAVCLVAITGRLAGRQERGPGRNAVCVAGIVLGLTLATWRSVPAFLGLPGSFLANPVLMAGCIQCAAVLAAMTSQLGERARRVSELVADLGTRRTTTLDRALRQLLADPTFRMGLWLAPAGRYVDPEGWPFEVEHGTDEVTDLDHDAVPVARLVHDPSLRLDASLLDGIATSASLATVNAALQVDLRAQVEALAASRDRLETAADRERAELRRRLATSMEPQLVALERSLREGAVADDTPHLLEEVAAARHELLALAEGLGPVTAEQTDIGAVVRQLAARCPVPVQMSLDIRSEPDASVRACVSFVISEALTNVVRHADASHVTLILRVGPNGVRLMVEDDGLGGAVVDTRGGIAGLRERVHALGGWFLIDSPEGAGTRIEVTLPARDEPAAFGEHVR